MQSTTGEQDSTQKTTDDAPMSDVQTELKAKDEKIKELQVHNYYMLNAKRECQ